MNNKRYFNEYVFAGLKHLLCSPMYMIYTSALIFGVLVFIGFSEGNVVISKEPEAIKYILLLAIPVKVLREIIRINSASADSLDRIIGNVIFLLETIILLGAARYLPDLDKCFFIAMGMYFTGIAVRIIEFLLHHFKFLKSGKTDQNESTEDEIYT